jgi:sortase A
MAAVIEIEDQRETGGAGAPSARRASELVAPYACPESPRKPRGGTGPSLTRSLLTSLAVVCTALFLNVSLLGGLEERAAQTTAFARLRNALAVGTAPLGQVDGKGRLLRSGTPVALLEIPDLHLREVIREGTTSQVLLGGPGHLRNTVLPGQAGTSVVFGRATAYGGPFGHLGGLRVGSKITVTTGIGTSTFRVVDLRRAGDPMPPPLAAGNGRLSLVTATGASFLPSGVLHVDADLQGAASASPTLAVTAVNSSESAMGTDTDTLWGLVLLLQLLLLAAVVGAWSWRQWGRVQTWIVFVPLLLLLGSLASDQMARLLPNLM